MADIYGGQVTLPNEEIADAVKNVLDRAYKVAFALRGPYPAGAAVRRSLGWIAVSGEDDPPHRPVNMAVPPYPQYEIPVTVGNATVKARFIIASPPLSPTAWRPPRCLRQAAHSLPMRLR